MKKLISLSLSLITLVYIGCKHPTSSSGITISPDMGTTYNAGKPVSIKLNYPADLKPDSIVFQLDSVRFAMVKNSSKVTLKTDTLHMGSRLITAKIYQGGKAQDISTNIMIYAPKPPEELTFVVEKVFPHDTSSYTEGLLYQDGFLYESDGGTIKDGTGQSSLRKVNLETGKVVKKVDVVPDSVFAEGISIIDDKIIQMTYREKIGFVYDKNTFKLLKTFPFNVGVEGWGLCYDGKQLYMDDKTNRIWFLNKDTYREQGYIDVCDDKKAIDAVNELEMINGRLYANVYTFNDILVINPKTGAVLQHADMTSLWPLKDRPAGFDSTDKVLNGIAWDDKGKRLFVTGKKWPHLYQIRFEKK